MRIFIEQSEQAVAQRAAGLIFENLANTDGPFGVATGSTPTPIYEQLSQLELSPSMKLFALDEYFQIDPNHPSSFRQTLIRELVRPCGFSEDNLHLPPASADESEIEKFEVLLNELGPVKIQLLGIGSNGHVAFNEPGSELESTTRKVKLHQTTIVDNQRHFQGEMPRFAVTQGIATIMRSEALLLVARGKHKAKALASMFGVGDLTPASHLAKHPNLIIVADSDAAALIESKSKS